MLKQWVKFEAGGDELILSIELLSIEHNDIILCNTRIVI